MGRKQPNPPPVLVRADFVFRHGQPVKDLITGFKGTITARADYITGCNQYLVSPPCGKDKGEIRASSWFDEDRIMVMPGKTTTLDVGTKPGGPKQDQAPGK